MKDQKLLTLKQVADQIGVNYKTIHHYRDVFEEFMMIQFAGRRVKYLPENADLFCKILELKDEGHSSDLLTDSPTDHPTDIHSDIQSDIYDRVTGLFFEYLKEIFGHLETTLQKSTTQTNIAITALCESTQDIRNGLLSINDRLARLERDLDVEAAEPLEIYEVDARNYQVDLPEISLPDIPPLSSTSSEHEEPTPQDLSGIDDHDLGSVRDSIDNGMPDRDVLVDWAMEKRQQDENTYSYNVLAGILNKFAIPTMSGREKWSRSTVRNLLVRTLKNRE